MSKVFEMREKQGYTDTRSETCSRCIHFRSERVLRRKIGGGREWHENQMRCDIGGFAVKKMGSCKEWSGR